MRCSSGFSGRHGDGVTSTAGYELVEQREQIHERIDERVHPVFLAHRVQFTLRGRSNGAFHRRRVSLLLRQELHIREVDDELGELGEETRIAAIPHRLHSNTAQHALQLPNAITLHDVAVSLWAHADHTLEGSNRQAGVPVRGRDYRHPTGGDDPGELAVQPVNFPEMLVHIDDDDDIEYTVRNRIAVDVDVSHGVAQELRHLADTLRIDLAPAPLPDGAAKLVVHGAVVV